MATAPITNPFAENFLPFCMLTPAVILSESRPQSFVPLLLQHL